MDSTLLPSPSATPTEVRVFLSDLLRNSPQFTETDVDRLIERWTVGSGWELRTYTPAVWQTIFGMQEGWVLYREIRSRVLQSQQRPIQMIKTGPKCKSATIPYWDKDPLRLPRKS